MSIHGTLKKKSVIESIKKDINNFFKKIYWYPFTSYKYLTHTYFKKKRNDKNIISLLTISKNRSKRLKKVIERINKNTYNIENIEILVFIDDDEKEVNEYQNLINTYKNKININLYSDRIKNNTEKHNYLAKISKGDLIFLVTDDMYLEKNWDLNINIEANKFNKNESFCIWPKEIGLKYPYLHCNAPIINRKWFNKCGYYLHNKLYHYYADNWLCDLCRENKNFIISKKFIWKHEHPETNLELIDKTHIDLKSKSKFINEEKVYRDLQKEKKQTANRIKN